LTTSQIINFYQKYLDEFEGGGDAKENLLEFLEKDEKELLLNQNDQRIIFVANEYRKEVTSTVLWLLGHKIQIQCFRAIPYSFQDEIFLQVEQIIPLPETKEFMIDAMEKEQEEKSKSKIVEESKSRLVSFWSRLKKDLQRNGFHHMDSVSAKPYSDMGFIKGAGKYNCCLGRKTNRVELYFPNDPDNEIIDEFIKHRDSITEKLRTDILFEKVEGRKASKIKLEYPKDKFFDDFGDFEDEENWQARINWFVQNMKEFYAAVQPVAEKVLRGRSYNG